MTSTGAGRDPGQARRVREVAGRSGQASGIPLESQCLSRHVPERRHRDPQLPSTGTRRSSLRRAAVQKWLGEGKATRARGGRLSDADWRRSSISTKRSTRSASRRVARRSPERAERLPMRHRCSSGFAMRSTPRSRSTFRAGRTHWPGARHFSGMDGWFAFWREWLEPWQEFRYRRLRSESVSGCLVSEVDLSVRGRGAAFRRSSVLPALGLRDGRIVRLRACRRCDEAMRCGGRAGALGSDAAGDTRR